MSQYQNAARLLEILELETLELNLFRGHHEIPLSNTILARRLFGGQVLAQALSAAHQTVDKDLHCHSLHGYFLRPGAYDLPVLYRVEPIRDGRSFSTRRILAQQNGEAIFSLDLSFHIRETGAEHQIELNTLTSAEETQDDIEWAMDNGLENDLLAMRIRPFETRSVRTRKTESTSLQNNPVWIKFRSPVKESTPQAAQQRAQQLLAYASDMGMVSTSYLPHEAVISRNALQMASLDHALWFHRDIDISDWIVYIKDSTNASHSRGLNRGTFYDKAGNLLASSMQEGLIRNRPSR